MIVRIAAMKTRSTCIVGLIDARSPYAHAGIDISNNRVTTVMIASIRGDTISLTAENVNII
jgi:hypothetical protein